METNQDQFLEVAKDAALAGGKQILKYFHKKHKVYDKGESSNFATQADLDAEKVIINIISKNFPTHNIISEEKGQINKTSEYTWVIDPLDGTISFAAEMPFFAVEIGLLRNFQPILGVVYWVTEDKLFYAQLNKGAYMNNQKITVSKAKKLENSVLAVDFGHINSRKTKFDKYIEPIMYKSRYTYALASDALALAFVAQGGLDGFPTDANIWDFAGGAILVTEAGGKISDCQGNNLDWSKKRLELVASNGLIHDEMLKELI